MSADADAGTSAKGQMWTDADVDTREHRDAMFGLRGCVGYDPNWLDDLVRKPNVSDVDQDVEKLCVGICGVINGGRPQSGVRQACVGTLVSPGFIGLVSHNGKVEAVPNGRWQIPVWRSRTSWSGIKSLSFGSSSREACVLEKDALTIVRVPRGYFGLAKEGGSNLVLGEGVHVYNDVLFKFVRLEPVSRDYIHHDTLHIVRVRRGEYCKVWCLLSSGAQVPRLLEEGCYAVDSNLFSMDGRCAVAEPVISHGVLHVLQVSKGYYAKVFRNNEAELLPLDGEDGPHWGPYYINCPNFRFDGTTPISTNIIKHGTITIVRVNRGEVGLAWKDSMPFLMRQPNVYRFDTPTFVHERNVPVTEKIIQLGTQKIVTVYSGEVGISYNKGKLQILDPGSYEIEDEAHWFDSFLSTQQRIVRLQAHDGKLHKEDLLVCETKDFVKVGIRADVFYAIKEPEKTIQRIAKDEIEKLVLDTSLAAVTNIFRSTTLNDIAQSKTASAVSSASHQEKVMVAQAVGDSSAPLFFERAHDEFVSKVHDDFMKRYGIEITDIRIESFKIMGEDLATSISQQALTTAATECQLANLAGQREIETKQQETKARSKQIEAESEANALKTRQDAENEAHRSKKRTEAEAELFKQKMQAEAEQFRVETGAKAEVERAKADAEATRLRGQAEADALEARSRAEATRAQMLSETPLGSQLSLLTLYSDMVAKSNEGVEKVIYSDMSNDNAGILGLATLQTLGRDLAAMQAVDQPRR